MTLHPHPMCVKKMNLNLQSCFVLLYVLEYSSLWTLHGPASAKKSLEYKYTCYYNWNVWKMEMIEQDHEPKRWIETPKTVGTKFI